MIASNEMDLTVVINCSDDLRILSTLASIDIPDVKVVSGITSNTKIEQILNNRKIPYAVVPKGSHSATTNAGISLVKTSKFFLIDSDCVFLPGSLALVNELLNHFLVVKGKIFFESDNSPFNRLISECRDFDNTYEKPLYKPGIGFRTDVYQVLGKWFDEELSSTVDAELSYRIYKTDLSVKHLDMPVIKHAPISLSHNIKSCIRYGYGDAQRYYYLGQNLDTSLFTYEIKRYKTLLNEKGLKVSLFMMFNDFFYFSGYFQMVTKYYLQRMLWKKKLG